MSERAIEHEGQEMDWKRRDGEGKKELQLDTEAESMERKDRDPELLFSLFL